MTRVDGNILNWPSAEFKPAGLPAGRIPSCLLLEPGKLAVGFFWGAAVLSVGAGYREEALQVLT